MGFQLLQKSTTLDDFERPYAFLGAYHGNLEEDKLLPAAPLPPLPSLTGKVVRSQLANSGNRNCPQNPGTTQPKYGVIHGRSCTAPGQRLTFNHRHTHLPNSMQGYRSRYTPLTRY